MYAGIELKYYDCKGRI